MVHSVLTGAVYGVGGYLVTVEVDMADGLPCMEMVGFLGSEVKESAHRIRVALKNAGYDMPPRRFTINLSPAGIRKGGSAFDLPIAIGVLKSMGIPVLPENEKILAVGELGLEGTVRGVRGILPVLLAAKEKGIGICVIPEENRREGECIEGMKIVGIRELKEIMDYPKLLEAACRMKQEGRKQAPKENLSQRGIPDFENIIGQSMAKRAGEIAAAGFHNLLLSGPPGTGKSMLAHAMSGILPPMSEKEMLETSGIYSVAGLLNEEMCFVRERPFLNPHHTITPQALIGGGSMPKPGVISLANHGMLFLDELPEFKRQTLDMLRQPLEEGKITITRKSGSYTYPCDFMLVAAMNPCPCGYFPDINRCKCSEREVRRYVKSISGPLLNRFDLCVGVMRSSYEQVCRSQKGEDSRTIRERVVRARKIQLSRNGKAVFNGRIPADRIDELAMAGKGAKKAIEEYYAHKDLSIRGYHRLLRVARTIADLDGSEKIEGKHVKEAVSYRGMLDA